MAEQTVGVATVEGSLQQQQQQQGLYYQEPQFAAPPPQFQQQPPVTTPPQLKQSPPAGAIHSSATLTLDPATGQAVSMDQQQQQYRQSGSHVSCVSDKVDARAEALKEKEALEDRLERSVSGLSGRIQPSEGATVPYDPQCGCIAPIPPYATTPK